MMGGGVSLTSNYLRHFGAFWDDIPGVEEEEPYHIEEGVYVDDDEEWDFPYPIDRDAS